MMDVKRIDAAINLFEGIIKDLTNEKKRLMESKQEACFQSCKNESETGKEVRKLRGLPGIMEIFHCSKSTAARIKDSGVIDCAMTRISPRIFLVDEQKALEAMAKRKGGRNY